MVVQSEARLIYDDGTEDIITFPDKTFSGVASGSTDQGTIQGDHLAVKNGWLVEWGFGGPKGPGTGASPRCSVWVVGGITPNPTLGVPWQRVLQGYLNGNDSVCGLGQFQPWTSDLWPEWVFLGTVAEDATAGTHVCTLTVSPGAGGSLEVLYASITKGNTATAQTARIYTTDGTNVLVDFNAGGNANTNASAQELIGSSYASSSDTQGKGIQNSAPTPFRISGGCQLVLSVSTTAVSVTQTFAVVARLYPATIPTAVLADAVGSPTLTTTTNLVV